MNPNHLEKRLNKLYSKTRTLSTHLKKMTDQTIIGNEKDYESYSLGAVHMAEEIACSLRGIAVMAPNLSRNHVIEQMIADHNIQIIADSMKTEIVIPALLPKRISKHGSNFITDPMFYALYEYTLLHPLEKVLSCVIVFEQIANRTIKKSVLRDYDNNEYKPVLDVLSTFFLVDDNPEFCQLFHCATYGEQDETRIHIIRPENFGNWYENRLKKEEKNVQKTSDF